MRHTCKMRHSLGGLFGLLGLLAVCWFPGRADAQSARRGRRSASKHRRHVRKGERYLRKGKYRQAIKEFQAALVHRRDTRLFYSIGLCYEKMGKKRQAIFYYKLYLRETPRGKMRATVKQRLGGLGAGGTTTSSSTSTSASGSGGGTVVEWARKTRFTTIKRIHKTKPIFRLIFKRVKAKKRRGNWVAVVQYLPKKKWVLIYTTVLSKVAKKRRLPISVLYYLAYFNSAIPGAKLTIDKRNGNIDAQYEIKESQATVASIDYMLSDVINTADAQHDKLKKAIQKAGRKVGPARRPGPRKLPPTNLDFGF